MGLILSATAGNEMARVENGTFVLENRRWERTEEDPPGGSNTKAALHTHDVFPTPFNNSTSSLGRTMLASSSHLIMNIDLSGFWEYTYHVDTETCKL